MSDYEEVLGSVTASDSGGGAAGYGSGLVGGILDAFIGPVMANEQFQRSKHVSNRQMQAAKFVGENQPSWAMEGLRRAGLNPMLAYTRGLGPAQFAPSVRAETARTGSFASALSRGVSNARQLKMLDLQSNILLNQARKAKNEADASNLLTNRMNAEISEIFSRRDSYDQSVQTSASQVDVNSANAERIRTLKELDSLGIPAARADAELYSTEGGSLVRQAGPVIRLLREILGAGNDTRGR